MKKGDLKKQEIIRTAETLFCRYGYENTSIQDILDELNTSKGSFYHHFVSKESLLEEICRSRAKGNAAGTACRIMENADPLEKLNILFSDMIPFSGEKLSFLLMILPVFLMPEGISLRAFYARELGEIYREPVADALLEGTREGAFSCREEEFFAEISLQIVNNLWMKICDLILHNEQEGRGTEATDLMNLVNQYRLALERVLGAPFGSIELIRLPELKALADQIHQNWK